MLHGAFWPFYFSPKGQGENWSQDTSPGYKGWQARVTRNIWFVRIHFFLEFLVYFFSSLWKPPPLESIFSFETGFIKGEVQVPASYKRSHTLPLYVWEFKEVVTWVAGCQKKIISEINNIDCLFPSKTRQIFFHM